MALNRILTCFICCKDYQKVDKKPLGFGYHRIPHRNEKLQLECVETYRCIPQEYRLVKTVCLQVNVIFCRVYCEVYQIFFVIDTMISDITKINFNEILNCSQFVLYPDSGISMDEESVLGDMIWSYNKAEV